MVAIFLWNLQKLVAFFKVIININNYCIKFLYSSFKDYIICNKKLDYMLYVKYDKNKLNLYIKNN